MKKMLILIMGMMPLFVFAQAFDESADGKIEKGEMKGDVFTGFLFDPEKGYIYNGSKYCKTKDGKFVTGTKIDLIKKNREVFTKSKSVTYNDLDSESRELLDTYYPLYAFYKLKMFDKLKYKDLNKVGEAYVFIPNKKDLKKTKVLWTGELVDGQLNGGGVGIAYIYPDYVYVKCDDFKNGFPTGSLSYRIMKPIWDGKYMKVEETYYEISNQSQGQYLVKMNGVKENKEFIVNKEGSFVDYSEAQKDKEYRAFMGFGKLVTGIIAAKAVLDGFSDSGSSSSYTSSRNTESETESSSKKETVDIDQLVENLSLPRYQFDGDWEKESLLPSDKKNEGGENQFRRIKFNDAPSGKIIRVIGNKGYWSSKNCRYETLDDAIIAEYAYKKYNKVREKGRMHGIFY